MGTFSVPGLKTPIRRAYSLADPTKAAIVINAGGPGAAQSLIRYPPRPRPTGPLPAYRVIYWVKADRVEVLAVVHGRRAGVGHTE